MKSELIVNGELADVEHLRLTSTPCVPREAWYMPRAYAPELVLAILRRHGVDGVTVEQLEEFAMGYQAGRADL